MQLVEFLITFYVNWYMNFYGCYLKSKDILSEQIKFLIELFVAASASNTIVVLYSKQLAARITWQAFFYLPILLENSL